MTLPKSKGLVTLDEIRACMDRIDATLTVLLAAVKTLSQRPASAPAPPNSAPPVPRPPPAVGKGQGWYPSQTGARDRYAAEVRMGQEARAAGAELESCPFVGDRGIPGARRKWWRYGWATLPAEAVP